MMKRVCNTRVGACAMLLAVFLLVFGAGSPAFARKDMSAGQAGDPGDGDEVCAATGSSASSSISTNQITSEPKSAEFRIILMPVITNGMFVFQLIVLVTKVVGRR
jgi:hypothetical protein